MTPLTTTTRNADLMDLAALLTEQQAAKFDVVVPATQIQSVDGTLVVKDTDVALLPDDTLGLTPGRFRPTAVCDEGLAEKLGVPVGYLKRLRTERPDLYDANVNGWLHGDSDPVFTEGVGYHQRVRVAADARSFLLRTFRQPGADGIARAFLSDGFKIVDNLDVLTAALEGVRASGADVHVEGCDLTERRMSIRVVAPAIEALAPTLLAGYRSPFDHGATRAGDQRPAPWETPDGLAHGWLPPDERPVVFAGFVIGNSETGGGAFTITPRLVVKVCRNGLTVSADALRTVHLGGRMEQGIIRFSEETQERNLALVAAQARDAVATFLDADYVKAAVAKIEEKAGAPVRRPEETLRVIGQRLKIPQERTQDVLAHFIMGGSLTAGGVLGAFTSVAQTLADADDAAEMEGLAFRALDLAAAGA